jgi:hypothetical protein
MFQIPFKDFVTGFKFPDKSPVATLRSGCNNAHHQNVSKPF